MGRGGQAGLGAELAAAFQDFLCRLKAGKLIRHVDSQSPPPRVSPRGRTFHEKGLWLPPC